jgi:hypothetical protein
MEPVRLLALLEAAKDGSDYLDHAVARELSLRDRPVPPVTRSLDAAMSLVPSDWIVHRLGQVGDCRGGMRGWVAEICRAGDRIIVFPPEGAARTAPLAICISVLRTTFNSGRADAELKPLPTMRRSARHPG